MFTLRRTCGVLTLVASLVAVTACRPDSDPERPADGPGRDGVPTVGDPPPDLVDVQQIEPSIRTEIRYAGADNFVGEPVVGYQAAKCLLARSAAEALAGVQRELAAAGLGLLVYDCYRPQRAVDHFVRWAADTADRATKAAYYPNVDKSRLFAEGYIAERSGHSRGATVDLTLVREPSVAADADPAGGHEAEPLDMGTPYDFFDPRSHTESPEVTEEQLANRLRLREAMGAGGFRNYEAEWWHYTLRDEPYPDRFFDVPVR